jgi:hypothetical protein
MDEELPTIYRAKNLQEAQLLCNLLEDEGIRATIGNSVLQNGSGVDILGWPTLAQVMVAKEDAVRAREIAVSFDREVSGRGKTSTAVAETSEFESRGSAWPTCPECGVRRVTRCESCGARGSDFPPADTTIGERGASELGRGDVLGFEKLSGAASECSCGPGGCGAQEPGAAAGEGGQPSASPTLLLCPTCDEPFRPQFLRSCEACGHEFPDGVESFSTERDLASWTAWSTRAMFAVIFFGYLFLVLSGIVVSSTAFVILVALLILFVELFWLYGRGSTKIDER